MSNQDQRMQVQEQENAPAEEMERTRSRRVFVPRADIYETEDELVLLVDIPGASEKTVNMTLEKNVLTIDAYIEPVRSHGYGLAYAEYEEGDYRRVFHLSDEIDRDGIEATVSEGVLRLQLPKSERALTRKIAIKTAA
jgi:HSP20 family molecular chaperone IbpA